MRKKQFVLIPSKFMAQLCQVVTFCDWNVKMFIKRFAYKFKWKIVEQGKVKLKPLAKLIPF